jgi:(5-formylfuran-3-yl)methyl phosphate synthase
MTIGYSSILKRGTQNERPIEMKDANLGRQPHKLGKEWMTQLLVSVRGPTEAKSAVAGGAAIIDAEYPFSALGSAYPLNIRAIRRVTPSALPVSTNIGEKQYRWSTSSQAAVGVALAGADIIKAGLGNMEGQVEMSTTVANRIVRNVKYWFPTKKVIPTLFADFKVAKSVRPELGPMIASKAAADGLLIDTFDKGSGKNLFDHVSPEKITEMARKCHDSSIEFWVAGSLREEHFADLLKARVDVICVRGAACKGNQDRTGEVDTKLVKRLVAAIDP